MNEIVPNWGALIDKIHERDCVPFLGAGASLGFEGKPGLPTAGEIAVALVEDLGKDPATVYRGSDKQDFLRVCQYYELVTRDKRKLRKAIGKLLHVQDVEPGTVHRSIAALPFGYVLTTNYDSLMERAFGEVNRPATVEVYDVWGDARKVKEASEQMPMVYKLHGTLDRQSTMLCTEDDVVQFLACLLNGNPALPGPIKCVMQEKSFLFVGYGLRDWNVRAVLRALRHEKKDVGADWTRSFAVQRRPQDKPVLAADWDASVLYWDQRETVHCFDVDAAEFMRELAARYRQAHPADTYPKQAPP
jgi:hypothetical protein